MIVVLCWDWGLGTGTMTDLHADLINALSAPPLGWLYVLTAVSFCLCAEAGYQLGHRHRRRRQEEKASHVGILLGALFGLLALMLSFTFGMTGSRFDVGRQLILKEANAIGTAYRRAKLLAVPQGENIQQLLREYVDARLLAADVDDFDRIREAIATSEQLQERLWAYTVELGQNDSANIASGLLMQLFTESMNNVIDIHSERIQYAFRNRVPPSIWLALYVITWLTMVLMGYLAGLSGTRTLPATLAVILTVSAVLCLINDLDRPLQRFFKTIHEHGSHGRFAPEPCRGTATPSFRRGGDHERSCACKDHVDRTLHHVL